MSPQVRVQQEVLQVPIARADRTAEPRRNEDANRCQPVGMNIKEPENFWLREPDRVHDRTRLKSAVFAEFDHHLHTQSPFARALARWHSDVFVNFAADCSYRTVAYHRQRGVQ